MQLFYLAAFLTGLLLGVYAMIRGVERIGTGNRSPELDAMGRPIGVPRMALSAPTLSGLSGSRSLRRRRERRATENRSSLARPGSEREPVWVVELMILSLTHYPC